MQVSKEDLWNLVLIKSRNVTILALGRGVGLDGKLSAYGCERVQATLEYAEYLRSCGHTVKIVWTGGASRRQVTDNTVPIRSEAQAMLAYAQTLFPLGEEIEQKTEDESISTVENMVRSASKITGEVIVIVTDKLHCMLGRVRFIAWIVFPRSSGKRVQIHKIHNSPDVPLKSRVSHILSLVVTAAAMFMVKRGDGNEIMKRQRLVEHLMGVHK